MPPICTGVIVGPTPRSVTLVTELISVDGYYQTAEEMDPNLRGRPAQCWLEDRVLSIAALD